MIVTGVLMTVKGANEAIPIAATSTNVTANPGLSVLITLSSNLCFSLRNLNQTLLSKGETASSRTGFSVSRSVNVELFALAVSAA